ncbi:hypothetical protein BJY01DRAFT_261988 [Aspergillus pseudoustus]|uniref:Uncharacterized protein n=1 Tax=Aspergillus pseudoustus TaxID=1810923 RepID=A0ABR4KYL4_9EURO
MPVEKYGVWKAHLVHYVVERRKDDLKSPHLSLYFHDHEFGTPKYDRTLLREDKNIQGLYRATINIKSGLGDPHDSRLVYWVNRNIDQNPLADELTELQHGFHAGVDQIANQYSLDYIRDSLFNTSDGRLLPHEVAGQFNNIIDVLEPSIQQAIDENADVYLFGSRGSSGRFMHKMHMNQGNVRKYRSDDGVSQDGGLIIHFQRTNSWIGFFIGFASQAVHTDDQTGHAITGVTWSDFLRPDIIEEAVVIQEAYVNPADTRPRSIMLSNKMNRALPLEHWTIRNKAGDIQILPDNASLRPRIDQLFDLPDCPLSDHGDTIILANEQGMRIDGVSYNSKQAATKGDSIVFAH